MTENKQPELLPARRPEHPGKQLRLMLDAKGWSQEELAAIAGYKRRQTISDVVAGKSGITPDMAMRLAAAFGNQPGEWLQWDAAYQLSLLEPENAAIVEKKALLYSIAPVREMEKRGWIREAKTPEQLESELTRFFGRPVSHGLAFPVAMLKSDPLADLNPAEQAWCFRARQLAEGLAFVAEFSPARLPAAQKKLRQLAAYPKEAERLPEILAYFGIRFVVVEPLPGARVDGAAFWINDAPVIAVSARWDRIDAFWFTVMHEFMHIKNGDALSCDVNLVADGDNGMSITATDNDAEGRANSQAADALVPVAELQSFIQRTSPFYATAKIVQFANRIKMHPGIIVGQLQHRGELRYSSHRDFLVRVRKFVVETAVTDGWGRTLSPSVF